MNRMKMFNEIIIWYCTHGVIKKFHVLEVEIQLNIAFMKFFDLDFNCFYYYIIKFLLQILVHVIHLLNALNYVVI